MLRLALEASLTESLEPAEPAIDGSQPAASSAGAVSSTAAGPSVAPAIPPTPSPPAMPKSRSPLDDDDADDAFVGAPKSAAAPLPPPTHEVSPAPASRYVAGEAAAGHL
jgi:hypothetical protein